MAWDNIYSINSTTNKIKLSEDLRTKYSVGKVIKVKETLSTNGKHEILSVTYAAGYTSILPDMDVTETSSGIGRMARVRIPLLSLIKRKRKFKKGKTGFRKSVKGLRGVHGSWKIR